MTRKSILAALTVSVLGSLTLTATAEAGGLRLGFGGPMASFVAKPTHGGGSGGYKAPSMYGRGAQCAKKRPQTQVASRHRPEPRHVAPKIVRNEAKPARQEKVQAASVQRETSKPKTRVAAVARTVTKTAEQAETATSTNASPVESSGALALAQTENAATTAAANAETPVVEAVEEPVVVAETTVTPADTTVTAAAQPEVTAEEPAKDVGCKKFIPSVGVTIDVGCEK